MKKIKLVLLSLMILLYANLLFSQVTDKEKELLKRNTDTTSGWKKGGMISLAFSQISLTHWAAGGTKCHIRKWHCEFVCQL